MATRLPLVALLAWVAASAVAAPDLSRPREIGPLRFFPDHEHGGRFYYGPGELELARDANGRPDLRFLQMRYVGTAAYGNQGESGSFSTLTLRMRLDEPSAAELQISRRALERLTHVDRVELRPLPVARFEALLVYAPIGGEAAPDVLDEGFVESGDAAAASAGGGAVWRERVFTVPMDARTSQLLWELMQRGEVALSVAYVFFSRGVHTNEAPELAVTASEAGLEEQLAEALRGAGVPVAERRPAGLLARLLAKLAGLPVQPDGPKQQAELELRTQMIRSGATAIRVDARRWPELFQRVDFNEQAPPGYAALKVYCYDFANELRPELVFTKVEIEAESIGGRRVPLETKFLRSQPDLYARTIRFPVAVHLDRPFRYRVSTARRDGTLQVGPWLEREGWGQILDITSRPEPAHFEGEDSVDVEG